MSLLMDALKKAELAKREKINALEDLQLQATSTDTAIPKNPAVASQRALLHSQKMAQRLAARTSLKESSFKRKLYVGMIATFMVSGMTAAYVFWSTSKTPALPALVKTYPAPIATFKPVNVESVIKTPLPINLPQPASEKKSLVPEMAKPTSSALDTDLSQRETPHTEIKQQIAATSKNLNNAETFIPNTKGRSGRREGKREIKSIKISPAQAQLDPQVEVAYQALIKGNISAAQEIYEKVLQKNARHQDALLGLATIAMQRNQYQTAQDYYLRALENDPHDSYALAGLLGLNPAGGNTRAESRIKSLLAVQPQAHHLYFVLGNQYAAQSRWSEAQQAYFQAYSSDSSNPDYCFNLAVSLDQLHQAKLAIQYYQQALNLPRAAHFDREQAKLRMQQLVSGLVK